VFAMVLILAYFPVGVALNMLPIPEMSKKFLRKVSQTRSASAVTEGPDSPNTDAGVGVGGVCNDNGQWSGTGSPGGTFSNNTNYVATTDDKFDSGNSTDELRISDYRFVLTNVSTIDGITVEIIVFTDAGGATYKDVVLFTAPGSRRGDDKSTGATVDTVDPGTTYTSFGGATDDWFPGDTWTEAEIEATGFGVVLCFESTAANTVLNLDHVRITIDYTQTAEATLTFTIDAGGSQNFGTLTAGTRKTGTTRLKIDTDASGGYTITAAKWSYISDVTMYSKAQRTMTIDDTDIPEFTGLGTCVSGPWVNGSSVGFGFVLYSSSISGAKDNGCWGPDGAGIETHAENKYARMVASSGGPSSFITTTTNSPNPSYASVGYSLDVTVTQAATLYEGAVEFIATAPPP